MRNKKIFSIILIAIFAFTALVACDMAVPEGDLPAPDIGSLQDGFYFATDDGYSNGWKYNLALEIKDGNIVDAQWNAISLAGKKDKHTFAADGEYGMIKASQIEAEWHEQADKASKFLVDQGVEGVLNPLTGSDDTDAISGVTVNADGLFQLAKKALSAKPLAKGDLKDGYYYAEEKEESNGERPFVQLVVLNGSIVDANINVLMNDTDKKTVSKAGDYGMDKIAKVHMHEQLTNIGNFLVTNQSTDVNYIDDQKTDAITGATIGVKGFFDLVDQALQNNPDYPIFK